VGSIPNITLNNGQAIPQFGFGVFQIEPKDTAAAVSTALEAGYRHIDTVEMYGNEAEVGEAIAKSGLDRGEVFVTSKLGNDAHEPDAAREAFDATLKSLPAGSPASRPRASWSRCARPAARGRRTGPS
jgi:2,5-diketo-D-gluconate reductase A